VTAAGLVLAIALVGNPQVNTAQLEQKIHTLINSERRKNNIKPLVLDEQLSNIARAHSQDMANRHFFEHVNPDGESPRDRVRLAGYNCPRIVGENIFQNNLYSRVTITGDRKTYDWNSPDEIATSTVHGWMNSSGHRKNILEVNYVKTGVGIAIAGEKVYITQVFCG
jgi:uncharacterized protein YkwD